VALTAAVSGTGGASGVALTGAVSSTDVAEDCDCRVEAGLDVGFLVLRDLGEVLEGGDVGVAGEDVGAGGHEGAGGLGEGGDVWAGEDLEQFVRRRV
jgi:hypothetical protein